MEKIGKLPRKGASVRKLPAKSRKSIFEFKRASRARQMDSVRQTAQLGRETADQLVRFGAATGLSAVVSLGLPVFLHEAMHVDQKLAVGISQATVLLLNFITVRVFVFRGKGSVSRDILRYLGSAAVFRALEYASFLLLLELAGLYYLTALVVTLLTSTLIKFLWYRFLFAGGAAHIS